MRDWAGGRELPRLQVGVQTWSRSPARPLGSRLQTVPSWRGWCHSRCCLRMRTQLQGRAAVPEQGVPLGRAGLPALVGENGVDPKAIGAFP